ncbi:MAG: glycosyltransferase family 4 protein [Candidatus Bathyarchaeia archaeon]|jgi:glycosyltransferase involved in cell wall biosynthesis
MKVCFLAPELYPIWGGGGTYAVGLLKYLPKDVEIHVLATQRLVPEDKSVKDESLSFGDNVNIKILAKGKDTFFSQANFQRLCYKWIPRLHKEHHFDVIHGQHQPMSDILLKLASKKLCYLTTVHETFSRRNSAIKKSNVGFGGFESSERWMLTFAPFLEGLEKAYMKKSSAFISPSGWMKNVLSEDFGARKSNIQVVYNGVDHRKFSPNVKRSEFIESIYNNAGGPIVLFSGRMISTKGVHVLVKAMPYILREVKDAHFVFTGGGNSQLYRQMIQQMHIPQRNYNFVGYIRDFNDIPGLYSIASVFVAPTLYENFPFRVLENMSCQKPVVASRIVGIPEMITDEFNGLLVPPSDPKALANKIVEVLSDKSLANKLSQNARRTIEEQFTFQKFADETKAAYHWAKNNFSA